MLFRPKQYYRNKYCFCCCFVPAIVLEPNDKALTTIRAQQIARIQLEQWTHNYKFGDRFIVCCRRHWSFLANFISNSVRPKNYGRRQLEGNSHTHITAKTVATPENCYIFGMHEANSHFGSKSTSHFDNLHFLYILMSIRELCYAVECQKLRLSSQTPRRVMSHHIHTHTHWNGQLPLALTMKSFSINFLFLLSPRIVWLVVCVLFLSSSSF